MHAMIHVTLLILTSCDQILPIIYVHWISKYHIQIHVHVHVHVHVMTLNIDQGCCIFSVYRVDVLL